MLFWRVFRCLSLEVERETFEKYCDSTVADNLRTGVQDTSAEHSRYSITRVNKTYFYHVIDVVNCTTVRFSEVMSCLLL